MARKITARAKARKKSLRQFITTKETIVLQKQVKNGCLIVHAKQEKLFKPSELVERSYEKTTTKVVTHKNSSWEIRLYNQKVGMAKAIREGKA